VLGHSTLEPRQHWIRLYRLSMISMSEPSSGSALSFKQVRVTKREKERTSSLSPEERDIHFQGTGVTVCGIVFPFPMTY
jgi:hypothetical protein